MTNTYKEIIINHAQPFGLIYHYKKSSSDTDRVDINNII